MVAPEDITQLSLEVSGGQLHGEPGGDEAEARGDAIRLLGEAPTFQSVDALSQAVRTDPDLRNRILAVNSLRILGRNSPATREMRAALRAAVSDPDANVANHAREALREPEGNGSD